MSYQSNAAQRFSKFLEACRGGWLRFALVALLVFFAVQPSYSAVATRVGGSLTAPAGIVFLGADPWVSDHILGFCRLDPGATPGTFVLNPTTCSTAAAAVGQAAVDGNNVYLTDNDLGVVRLTFNPATRTVGSPVVIAAGLLDVLSLPTGAAFGPDGALYVSYIRSGNIDRVVNPGGAAGTQTVTTIGTESAGAAGEILSMTFVGSDLYFTAAGTPEVITNAPACLANGCTGSPVATTVSVPTAIAFDGTNLFIGTGSAIYRFDPATPAVPAVMFANGGTIPPATTVFPFQGVSAIAVNGTTLLAGDDPTAGGQFGQGRLWRLLTTDLPGPSFPNMVLGTLAAPPLNFTAPPGLMWLPGALGGHFWVSDHLQGFCRLDPDLGGLLAINVATCRTDAVSPGQAGFDPFRNFVYLPDNARNNTGIHRLTFNPVTETITAGVPIINDVNTINDQPSSVAFGPDGKAYVGFIRTAAIRRIANPQGPTPTMENVGAEPGGIATTQLAFVGNDLFVAGSLNLGHITNAPACSGACTAGVVAGSQISTPMAITFDGSRFLYIGTLDSVWRFNPTTGIAEVYSNLGNTTVLPTPNQPYQNFSALALNPRGILFGLDDPSGLATPLVARLWAIQPYLLPIKEAKIGEIGTQVTYTLNFKNTSGLADTFTLTHLGHAWVTTGVFDNTGTTSSGLMAIDAETTVTITVTVPTGIFPLSDTVEVSATSDTFLTNKTFSLLTTTKQLFPIHLPVILGGAVKP